MALEIRNFPSGRICTAGTLSPKLYTFPPMVNCITDGVIDDSSFLRYSNDTDHSGDINGIVASKLLAIRDVSRDNNIVISN